MYMLHPDLRSIRFLVLDDLFLVFIILLTIKFKLLHGVNCLLRIILGDEVLPHARTHAHTPNLFLW